MLHTRKVPRGISWQFFLYIFFFSVVLAECKQAASEYKRTTRIYTRIIDIRSLEGKLYTLFLDTSDVESTPPRRIYSLESYIIPVDWARVSPGRGK